FEVLPSGRRLRSIRTKTSRHNTSFFPSAVGLINKARDPHLTWTYPSPTPQVCVTLTHITLQIHIALLFCILLSTLLFYIFVSYILCFFVLMCSTFLMCSTYLCLYVLCYV